MGECISMNNRTEFNSYIRWFAPCPRCQCEHVMGLPQYGERIGCFCGTRLVVTQEKKEDGWHLYLEVDTGQIVNP